MAKLEDLDAHRSDFTPRAPNSETDECKCPECGTWTPFSQWVFRKGLDEGYFCEDCNDFHSCFECPGCGEFLGAAGSYTKAIEVRKSAGQNHVRDAVLANQ